MVTDDALAWWSRWWSGWSNVGPAFDEKAASRYKWRADVSRYLFVFIDELWWGVPGERTDEAASRGWVDPSFR